MGLKRLPFWQVKRSFAIILLLLGTGINYSYGAAAGVPFTGTYEKTNNLPTIITDSFQVQDISSEYFISIRSLSGNISLAEVKLNGKIVSTILSPAIMKKQLIRISPQLKNQISIRLLGKVGSKVEIKVLDTSAFKPIFVEELNFTKRQELVRTFQTKDPSSDHIILLEAKQNTKFMNFSAVKINGKVIASPIDFIAPKKNRIYKLVTLKSSNEMRIVSLIGKSNLKISILEPASESIKATIGTQGGTIALPNIASVSFPEGTFAQNASVQLERTSSPDTDSDFEINSSMFNTRSRVSYEVRINTGSISPNSSFTATIDVPEEFVSKMASTDELQVFAQFFSQEQMASTDSFQLVPNSSYDPLTKKITVDLPSFTFTNQRTADDSYEAVLLIAATATGSGQTISTAPKTSAKIASAYADPTKYYIDPLAKQSEGIKSVSMTSRISTLADESSCKGASLASPLAGELVVNSKFDSSRGHWGTDYKADDGTDIFAMASGTIEKVGFNEKPLKKPDPRSGKMVKGFGYYIIIKHEDGSHTLYAHLEKDTATLKAGDKVTAGDKIALSDNSGGSSGPHLHIQYAPNGDIFEHADVVDADACVGKNISGSIEVGDNGSEADDAFVVFLNGTKLGETSIGASNKFSASNLRPGMYVLQIRCSIAPDDAGTYGVTLNDGLTFVSGGTSASGVLSQGGIVEYVIEVPASQ